LAKLLGAFDLLEDKYLA